MMLGRALGLSSSLIVCAVLSVNAQERDGETPEISLRGLLSLYDEVSTPTAQETRVKCEMAVQHSGQDPQYYIVVIDSDLAATNLAFYDPNMADLRAGNIEGNTADGHRRLDLTCDRKGATVYDHTQRILARYKKLSREAFSMPTPAWTRSFLSSYLQGDSRVSVTGHTSVSLYEIRINEMTQISERLRGVLRLYLDMTSLRLTKITFVGSIKDGRGDDRQQNNIKVNINFVETKTQLGELSEATEGGPSTRAYQEVVLDH